MRSPSPGLPGHQPLDGRVVVFTGKLSSLGRRDACVLVSRLGGSTAGDVNARTTTLVVGAEGFGSGSGPSRNTSNKLKRAEELNSQGATIEILSEEQFCVLAGIPTPQALKRQYQAMRDLLARYRELREDHVRYLLKCGIVRPELRTNADMFFAFPHVAVLKEVNDGLADGRTFRSVVRSLLAARQGQLALDFRLDAAPAKILALRQKREPKPAASAPMTDSDLALAEEYFRTGSQLDDGDESHRDEAAAAYRRALDLNPSLVAALINLANIHYGRDELAEAQALYERAIGLEPDVFEAHFNLGNIHHDLGRFPEAQECYLEALTLNPVYADAHFYLAVTFEKMSLSNDARVHWRAYRQLAPNGEWVELAREFSE